MSAAGLRVVPADDLAAVAAFAESLRHVSWFAAVGQELTDGERDEAADYVRAIGFQRRDCPRRANGAPPRPRHATRNGAARGGTPKSAPAPTCSRAPATTHGAHALMTALSRVTLEASDVVLGAASIADARSAIADPALARVAAGAATQAAYQAGLALAAEAGDMHPFAIKFRLFAAGRWPLGLVGDTFQIF